MKKTRQRELAFPNGWGGKRRGAGRKPKGERAGAPHAKRAALAARFPVHVTVRLFARLRDIVGAGELAREIAAGASVNTLWWQLVADHPALGAYDRTISSAVNADYAKRDRVLQEGDEVAFLPPVSGG